MVLSRLYFVYGRAYATVSRRPSSVVCNVMYCG